MPDFDIIGEGTSGSRPSGILMGLDPAYQAKQQQVQQNQIALNQSQLFKDGLPTDGNGNTDWNAAYQKAMQAGAYDLAGNLVQTGIRMSSLNDHSTFDNPRGGGASGSSGSSGGLLSAATGAQPAAGGGMIAPAAGGDSYGRAPGGGYAGAGQIGPGGQGAAPAGSSSSGDGQQPTSSNPPDPARCEPGRRQLHPLGSDCAWHQPECRAGRVGDRRSQRLRPERQRQPG